jgi:hypothetical protein
MPEDLGQAQHTRIPKALQLRSSSRSGKPFLVRRLAHPIVGLHTTSEDVTFGTTRDQKCLAGNRLVHSARSHSAFPPPRIHHPSFFGPRLHHCLARVGHILPQSNFPPDPEQPHVSGLRPHTLPSTEASPAGINPVNMARPQPPESPATFPSCPTPERCVSLFEDTAWRWKLGYSADNVGNISGYRSKGRVIIGLRRRGTIPMIGDRRPPRQHCVSINRTAGAPVNNIICAGHRIEVSSKFPHVMRIQSSPSEPPHEEFTVLVEGATVPQSIINVRDINIHRETDARLGTPNLAGDRSPNLNDGSPQPGRLIRRHSPRQDQPTLSLAN